MAERKTFRDSNGVEHTVIKDPRYKLPIALPTGIYNILAEISDNSITTYKERKEASEKYYKMLQKSLEEEKKSEPLEKRRKKTQKHNKNGTMQLALVL
jgi:hypothetical protein